MINKDQSEAIRIVPGRTPFVVIGDDWGRHVSTQQHLFRTLIGRQPIIWVNSFGHRRPKMTFYDISRAVQKLSRMLASPVLHHAHAATDLPAIINPRALPWHNHETVRRFNTWSITRDIRRTLSVVAPHERPLLVSGTPAAYGVLGQLNELASIYYCLDDYGEIHGVERELIAPLERLMLMKVDAVVATAHSLTTSKRPASGRTLHLPQGVNFTHFSTPLPLPAEFMKLPRPILGFAGGVGPAIDFALLRAVAAAFAGASIVMVGPHQQTISKEDWPANMHFIGPRSYADLPRYVQAFDVGLIPYVHNDWTRAVDPLKLLEYLAAGIPVVSTRLPEALKYQDVVRLGDGPEMFVNAISESLREGNNAGRLAGQTVAESNRWELRAHEFVEFANTVITDRVAVQAGIPGTHSR